MNEQDKRDDQRRASEGAPLLADDPQRLATERPEEEDLLTIQRNQDLEVQPSFFERLAAWFRKDAPAPTRDSKTTEKTRGLVLLESPRLDAYFYFSVSSRRIATQQTNLDQPDRAWAAPNRRR